MGAIRTQIDSPATRLMRMREHTYAPLKDPDDIPAWTGGVIRSDGTALKYSTGFDDTPPNFHAGRIPAGSVDAIELYIDSDVDARRKGLEL